MSNIPIIGKLISPSAPQPVAAPPVVTPDSPQARNDQEKAAANARRASQGGQASDMLTGGAGLEKKPQTASTTLLGV